MIKCLNCKFFVSEELCLGSCSECERNYRYNQYHKFFDTKTLKNEKSSNNVNSGGSAIIELRAPEEGV